MIPNRRKLILSGVYILTSHISRHLLYPCTLYPVVVKHLEFSCNISNSEEQLLQFSQLLTMMMIVSKHFQKSELNSSEQFYFCLPDFILFILEMKYIPSVLRWNIFSPGPVSTGSDWQGHYLPDNEVVIVANTRRCQQLYKYYHRICQEQDDNPCREWSHQWDERPSQVSSLE